MIIGLMGYARSGKDTAASVLVNEFGFTRVAFADKLRDCLYTLNPIIFSEEGAHERVQDVVNDYGWDEAKASPEVRRLLQVLGTEVGRERIYPNVWVDAVCRDLLPGTNYVFTDVRFPNEVERIKLLGGHLCRISRIDTEPVNAHSSETAVDHVRAFQIHNDGSLEQLAHNVRLLHGMIDFHAPREQQRIEPLA